MKLKLTAASIAALGVVSFGTPAISADLGSSCCADLEERVAELEATTARKGNRKVSLRVSGQVNEAFIWLKEGDQNGDYLGNNGNSSSRIRLDGSAAIDADRKAGFVIELGVGNDSVSIRHRFLYIESKTLGQFAIGHTSQATDGVTEIDLGRSNLAQTLASFAPDGGSAGLDGGRDRILRYVSPTVAGFAVSASWSVDNEWDAALRYAGEFGAIRVAAGIGYRVDADDRKVTSGSVSVMHTPSGIFANAFAGQGKSESGAGTELSIPTSIQEITGASATETIAADKVFQWGARLGIRKKFNSLGDTVAFIDYSDAEFSDGSDEGNIKRYGLGLIQDIDAAAMSLYLGYSVSDVDGSDDKTQAVVGGAIIKF